jgi:hypothetical protein
MTPTAVVLAIGLIPAFLLGWFSRDIYERRNMTGSLKPPRVTRESLLIGLVVAALVFAVVAAVYTYSGNATGKDRDEDNFDCLANYVVTGQTNNKPATLANRAQSAAFRDFERGYSLEVDAKGLDKAQLKARWLALYKAYEDVQVSPLPDLREFCAERK